MGASLNVYLPHDVRLNDVTRMAGILAGCPAERRSLGNRHDGWFVSVPDASYGPTSVAEMASITIRKGEDPTVILSAWFHFEPDEDAQMIGYGRVLSAAPTEEWRGIARGLATFFGGAVDYDDCDSVGVDFIAVRPRASNCPSDGESWQEFQAAMMAVAEGEAA